MSSEHPLRYGSPKFYGLLEEMGEVHNRKSRDYASNDNPYGNYRFAGELATLFKHSANDAGFIGRIGEKIYRLANLESSGKTPSNESIEDTEVDICVITLLWMSSRREAREKKGVSGTNVKDQFEDAKCNIIDAAQVLKRGHLCHLNDMIDYLHRIVNDENTKRA